MVMSRKAASLPPEQRQRYLQQLQAAGASQPELLQVMGGGGAGAAGGDSNASVSRPFLKSPLGDGAGVERVGG